MKEELQPPEKVITHFHQTEAFVNSALAGLSLYAKALLSRDRQGQSKALSLIRDSNNFYKKK